MKVRNGFVSNSSSSSFIIRLDVPMSLASLKHLLFSGEDKVSFGKRYIDTDVLCAKILHDFEAIPHPLQIYNEITKLSEHSSTNMNIVLDNCPVYPESYEDAPKYDKDFELWAIYTFVSLPNTNTGYWYRGEVSDEDNIGAYIERMKEWEAIEYIKSNNH